MPWLVAFIALTLSYYGLAAYLIGVLKSRNPETYQGLEKPQPFWNDHRASGLMLWLLLGEYRALPGAINKAPFLAAHVVAVGVVVTFVGFFISVFAS